ncbi:hypothetical protein GCM10027440_16090 [Nocardiopsis coralliicola]
MSDAPTNHHPAAAAREPATSPASAVTPALRHRPALSLCPAVGPNFRPPLPSLALFRWSDALNTE